MREGRMVDAVMEQMLAATTHPVIMRGDFAAQVSANQLGGQRLQALIEKDGLQMFASRLQALNDYAERLAAETLRQIPQGEYDFEDLMDDDGLGHRDIPIKARVSVSGGQVTVDFRGTTEQVAGNINCPLSVTAAAVYYVFRCLMPPQTPACAGSFRAIRVLAPEGCLLNAQRPAATAAGNVETSTRVVDVVLGALAQALPDRIPAASHGSMNNLAMGARGEQGWDYYETLAGGMGAGPRTDGLSAVQTHMTNTLNTPVEVLERSYPLRITHYGIRRHSGGHGRRRGGDGLVREYEFLAPAQATLLTERRQHAPWGLAGAEAGSRGHNSLNGELLAGKQSVSLAAGDRLRIETPGGGGWGKAKAE